MHLIIKIKSFPEIVHEFTPQDCVAFDLDETIFTHKMKVLRAINMSERKKFLFDVKKEIGEAKYWYLFDKLPFMVVEDSVKLFIESLHEKKVETIGFTARRTGKWTKYCPRTVQDKTINILKDLNIAFNPIHFEDYVIVGANTNNTEYANQIVEMGMDEYEIKDDAMIKSNIIFTNNINKGLILSKIFEKFRFIPDTFVLIDDKEDNLIALIEAINEINKNYNTNIKFIGYHYTGAKDLLDNNIDFQIIELQKRKLIEESYYFFNE